jgi:hypothetical protein
MIFPHPESDLSLSLMVLGSELIEILSKKKGYVFIEDLLIKFLRKDERRTPDLFFDSLTFLYAIDAIHYEAYKIRKVEKNDYTQRSLF